MKRKPPLPNPITWTRQNVGRIAVNGAPPRWMARLPNDGWKESALINICRGFGTSP